MIPDINSERCSGTFLVRYLLAMSTKHIRTTGDLVRFDAALRITCGHCGSARTLSAMDAVEVLGLAPLSRAQARLKCSRCGKKGAKLAALPSV